AKEEKGHDDHDHAKEEKKDDGHGHGEEEASADVELSVEQRKKTGIETMLLKKRSIRHQITALSEVKLNQYKTIKVSPSITTRVEKRHVKLGDLVKKGALLATLHTITTTDISANMLATADLAASSAELNVGIAQAKGELAAASATWRRIQSLGKDAVSGKRFIEARIAKEQAEAKLAAYGKSKSQVKRLLTSGSKAVQKHFELRAEQAGMVIKDDFVLGQIVNPEDVLFVISDMDHLWVEANIKPNDVNNITLGSSANISVNDRTLQGKVIYIGRVLDEKTRTLPVRIEVNTKGASLYPGQFVKTSISSKTTQTAIVIPAESVLRGADGDWMLFVEEAPGRFVPKEVDIIQNLGESVVIEGVAVGTTIVSKGAFFVQSELAKSGFEIHNH
ncbi:MAG TPA: efflux RND transporter periplasmic adaptor subunit, partial [Calditrichaeota bacterium]|nr:efflux RND transporter periplasmic adaptor subunit [Calditrichota bacterium]